MIERAAPFEHYDDKSRRSFIGIIITISNTIHFQLTSNIIQSLNINFRIIILISNILIFIAVSKLGLVERRKKFVDQQ
ncbi:hypothetical protein DERF_008913 [Dermatophagoides farinae]|uniref:Uncharacterized protein n=1 Tax=Dermatophagoides farinae TaxID=6954 RepID=A0A922L585_DERFA|nr:hypothetical protein DERF_008913 [Dermatophagoides farinae]